MNFSRSSYRRSRFYFFTPILLVLLSIHEGFIWQSVGYSGASDDGVLARYASKVDPAVRSINWKDVFVRTFIANIQHELKVQGKVSPEEINEVVKRFLYYSRYPAIKNYRKIAAHAKTTDYAIEYTKAIFGLDPAQAVAKLGPDYLSRLVLSSNNSELSSFVKDMNTHRRATERNFFNTPLGAKVREIMKDYVLVIVPGFASHTQDRYSFTDIIEDANEFYERQDSYNENFKFHWQRPRKDNKYMPINDFYNSNKKSEIGFDVVEAMGDEMGESLGPNDKIVSEHFGPWLVELTKMKNYQGKKVILLGYSKGGPIVHELLKWASTNNNAKTNNLFDKIEYIVTYASVLQGAVPATNGFRALRSIVGAKTNQEAINKIVDLFKEQSPNVQARIKQGKVIAELSQVAGLSSFLLALPGIKAILDEIGVNPSELASTAKDIFTNEHTLRVLLEGINSMTAGEMLKWMLQNLNNQNFAGKTIFNISALSSVKDFLLPLGNSDYPSGFDRFGPVKPPQLAFTFGVNKSNKIVVNWPEISLDNMFMHLTSLTGFEESANGLYDTQVGWMDTKSLALDTRPLKESLNDEEFSELSGELKAKGINIDMDKPRDMLMQDASGATFIDLADIRATHWNASFKQAFIPPEQVRENQNYYEHVFPRKAFHASIIELITLYHLASK